jgi:protein-S-isoprenylcysteine O-methyltransferase Ste14
MSIFIIIPVITYFFGRYVDNILKLPEFPPFPWNLIFGFLIFFFGLSLGIKSTRLLYKLGGGLPWGEAKQDASTKLLVTSGFYSYIRNPMVLGYSLLPFGMGIMFQSIGMSFPISTIVLLFNVVIVKIFEEPNLEKRFGKDYLEYKKKTPFIIPSDIRFFKYFIKSLLKREPSYIVQMTDE